MLMRQRLPRLRRAGRALVNVLLFLLGFNILLIVLCRLYLLPALAKAQVAGPEERARLSGGAMLVLILVLFALVAGLLLTLRMGRYFFPHSRPKLPPTQYTDAWAESGRRLQTPPPEE